MRKQRRSVQRGQGLDCRTGNTYATPHWHLLLPLRPLVPLTTLLSGRVLALVFAPVLAPVSCSGAAPVSTVLAVEQAVPPEPMIQGMHRRPRPLQHLYWHLRPNLCRHLCQGYQHAGCGY